MGIFSRKQKSKNSKKEISKKSGKHKKYAKLDTKE